jgi:hypothetical protein
LRPARAKFMRPPILTNAVVHICHPSCIGITYRIIMVQAGVGMDHIKHNHNKKGWQWVKW